MTLRGRTSLCVRRRGPSSIPASICTVARCFEGLRSWGYDLHAQIIATWKLGGHGSVKGACVTVVNSQWVGDEAVEEKCQCDV